MRTLPDDVHLYKTTSVFTEHTLPDALRRAHTTAPDVWGRLVVEAGSLRYRITPREGPAEEHLLGPGSPGIIEPTVPHAVEPVSGPLRFRVEFLRRP